MGQKMNLVKESRKRSKNGYLQDKKSYQAQNCSGCPMRGACHKQKTNRLIEVSSLFAVKRTFSDEKGI